MNRLEFFLTTRINCDNRLERLANRFLIPLNHYWNGYNISIVKWEKTDFETAKFFRLPKDEHIFSKKTCRKNICIVVLYAILGIFFKALATLNKEVRQHRQKAREFLAGTPKEITTDTIQFLPIKTQKEKLQEASGTFRSDKDYIAIDMSGLSDEDSTEDFLCQQFARLKSNIWLHGTNVNLVNFPDRLKNCKLNWNKKCTVNGVELSLFDFFQIHRFNAEWGNFCSFCDASTLPTSGRIFDFFTFPYTELVY